MQKNEYDVDLKTAIDVFNIGMMRDYSDVLPMPKEGLILNIGAGNKLITGTIVLDYPEWDAETMAIPFADNSVDGIHCYHFLEHISNVREVIGEMCRVLKPGGVANIVVPYALSPSHMGDLDHKQNFAEKSFPRLFDSTYYAKDKLSGMSISFNMIMGDCYQNLCLVVQLVKD